MRCNGNLQYVNFIAFSPKGAGRGFGDTLCPTSLHEESKKALVSAETRKAKEYSTCSCDGRSMLAIISIEGSNKRKKTTMRKRGSKIQAFLNHSFSPTPRSPFRLSVVDHNPTTTWNIQTSRCGWIWQPHLCREPVATPSLPNPFK